MMTYSDEQLEGFKEIISKSLLKDHKEGDRTSAYSKFETLYNYYEMIFEGLKHYSEESKSLEEEILQLKNDKNRWTYVGFAPKTNDWYYTRDPDGFFSMKWFDSVKGWSPNTDFEEWLFIPEIHNVK